MGKVDLPRDFWDKTLAKMEKELADASVPKLNVWSNWEWIPHFWIQVDDRKKKKNEMLISEIAWLGLKKTVDQNRNPIENKIISKIYVPRSEC